MLKKLPLQAASVLINRALSADHISTLRLQQLAVQSIHIQCTEPSFELTLLIEKDGSLKLKTVDNLDSPATTLIRGNLSGFLHLLQSDDKASAMMASGLYLSGNSQLLQDLSQIFADADIDLEWLLANRIGDVPAHFIAKAGRQGQQWLNDKQPLFKRHLQEFVLEEVQLVPRHDEVELFIEQIQELKQRTERLEAKIKRLI